MIAQARPGGILSLVGEGGRAVPLRVTRRPVMLV
jgi:hypothetical protein